MQHMEDKLRLIHSAKDEVQQMNATQGCVISELQTKNNSLSMHVDNLKRQIETLQQVIADDASKPSFLTFTFILLF